MEIKHRGIKMVQNRRRSVKKRSNLAENLRMRPESSKYRQKTEEDYHKLAKARGLTWVGLGLPKDTLTPTKWQCLAKGHVFESRWADIYYGAGCGKCSGKATKTEADYHRLARNFGLKWLGPMPATTKHETWWQPLNGEQPFSSTYQKIRQRWERAGAIEYGD